MQSSFSEIREHSGNAMCWERKTAMKRKITYDLHLHFQIFTNCRLPFSAHSIPTMFMNFRKWRLNTICVYIFGNLRLKMPVFEDGMHQILDGNYEILHKRHVICEICQKMTQIAHFWCPEWLIQSTYSFCKSHKLHVFRWRILLPPSMQRPNEQKQRLSSLAINYTDWYLVVLGQ